MAKLTKSIKVTLLIVLCLPCLEIMAQSSMFDYKIEEVRMYEQVAETGELRQVESISSYLYDIGPNPAFVFEVEVIQLEGSSTLARRATLVVEQYLLLETHADSIYKGLNLQHPDAEATPAWTYHSPVSLPFTRSAHEQRITFTSSPVHLDFLDPDNAITFARPLNYKILGFAYRFALVPTRINDNDSNPQNNASQLTFLRP